MTDSLFDLARSGKSSNTRKRSSDENSLLTHSIDQKTALHTWSELLNHPVNASEWLPRIQDKFDDSFSLTIFDSNDEREKALWPIQLIENADSRYVNLDYYSLPINRLGEDKGAYETNEKALIETIRRNINSFISTDNSEFDAYDEEEKEIWTSDNPIGAVIYIDVAGPDNFAVVCSDYTDSDEKVGWTFATCWSPKGGHHVLGGVREFAIRKLGNGECEFYTSAIDRWYHGSDSVIGSIGGRMPVGMAFQGILWAGLIARVKDYVDNRGGEASNMSILSHFVEWENIKPMIE